MSILVVGSVAYDTVETPFGRAERVLGGQRLLLLGRGLVLRARQPGRRRGAGLRRGAARGVPRPADRHRRDSSASRARPSTGRAATRWTSTPATRICTDLNVFEFFKPKIPARYRGSEVVFLGNIDPVLQLEVLEQVESPRLVACDTMNFWIHGKPKSCARRSPRPRSCWSTTARRASCRESGTWSRRRGRSAPWARASWSSRRASTAC